MDYTPVKNRKRRKAVVRVPSEVTKLAYMAGIIDGEGCIHLRSCRGTTGNSESYALDLVVTNTDENLITWLTATFGGLWRFKRTPAVQHRSYYDWWVSGKNAGAILQAVLPYLVIKRGQAELGLQFLAHREGQFHGGRFDPVFVAERKAMKSRLQDLKRPHLFPLVREA